MTLRSGCMADLVAAMVWVAAPDARGVQGTAASPQPPRAVLDKYCVTCHNQRAEDRRTRARRARSGAGERTRGAWEKVVRKLRTGAMPPAGRPRPDKPVADSVASSLEAGLDRAAAEHPNPGRPTLHRLNRIEYRNAIRDLLALEIDAAVAAAGRQRRVRVRQQRRRPVAVAGLDRAVPGSGGEDQPDGAGPRARLRRAGNGLRARPIATRAAASATICRGDRVADLAFRYYFPVDGEYQFELQLKESGADGGIIGITAEPQQLDVSLDRARVWTSTVGGPDIANVRGQERTEKIREALQFRLPVKAGSHLVQVYFVQKTTAFVEDLFDPYLRRDPYQGGQWRAWRFERDDHPAFALGRRRGGGGERFAEPAPRVRLPARVVRGRGALRPHDHRNARPARISPAGDGRRSAGAAGPLPRGRERGGFESGLELAVRSILVSPRFLFRFESQPDTVAPNTAYRID